MLSNGSEIFEAFLEGVRKSRTTTIQPDIFTNIWNIWGLLNWIKSRPVFIEGAEMTEKEIDDFAMLRHIVQISPYDAINPDLFKLPDGTARTDIIRLDVFSGALPPIGGTVFPKYRRALTIHFKLDYDTATSQECSLTGRSDWLGSKPLKSDNESVAMKNTYTKAKDSRLRYQRIRQYIKFVRTTTMSQPLYMKLDYFAYPNWMEYSNGAFNYTPEFGEEQIAQILDLAIITYLERSKDPRWQTYLKQESMSPELK